ncbi:hypothetical protein GGE65_005443 [Skermanella aerolata]|uniref:hypothetical protein n=1 Tax=Skermanella aerolata TaxID=393310 RepID=UPI003D1B46CC
MASQNNDNSALMGLAFVGAALGIMALFLFAVLAFIAFVLTIMALLAWNAPLKMGNVIVEPHEARAFVARGLVGAAVLPVFVIFCAILFGIPINDDYWGYIVLGGYVGGSIGLEMLMADENPQPIGPVVMPAPEPQLPPQEPTAQKPPFQYATWDDEEENRS